MKKAISIMLVLLAVIMIAPVSVAQEPTGSTSASVSVSQPQVGDEFTVNVTVSSQEAIAKISASVKYDPALSEFISGNGAVGANGILKIDLKADGSQNNAEIVLKFKALAPGQADFEIVNCSVMNSQGVISQLNASKCNVSIQKAAETTTVSNVDTDESTDTTTSATTISSSGVPAQGVLTELKINNGTLVPPFMYSIHEYSVTVPYEIDKVEIEGKTASLQDHIWYTGNSDCVVGRNVRTITVTDINGQQTVYTIIITRLDKDEKQQQSETVLQKSEASSVLSRQTENSVMESSKDKDLKELLNPALYIVLIVLVVALFIVIVWIRSKFSKKDPKKAEKKAQKQRSKIKVTGGKNNKKK